MDESRFLAALANTVNPPQKPGKENRLLRPKQFGRAARVVAKLYGSLRFAAPERADDLRREVAALVGDETTEKLDQITKERRAEGLRNFSSG